MSFECAGTLDWPRSSRGQEPLGSSTNPQGTADPHFAVRGCVQRRRTLLTELRKSEADSTLRSHRVSRALIQAGGGSLLLLSCSHLPAQTTSNTLALHQQEQWTFSASVYSYFPPDAGDYLQPTLTADRDWLHLEARYNYEALDTGSAWLGYNFTGGEKVKWELSPMLGGMFGKVTGVAPGCEASLSWRRLELYSEGEYVIDLTDSSASYFYNWSELTLSVPDPLRVGLVVQHTHVYQTDREIQRGLLIGISYKSADVTAYIFNPGESASTVVIAVRASW